MGSGAVLEAGPLVLPYARAMECVNTGSQDGLLGFWLNQLDTWRVGLRLTEVGKRVGAGTRVPLLATFGLRWVDVGAIQVDTSSRPLGV